MSRASLYFSSLPSGSHFVRFTHSPPLCYLLKITNNGLREKKIFFIYGCFSLLRNIKEVKIFIFIYIAFFTHIWINNPYWQISRILTILCNYFLMLVVILSGLHEQQLKKGSVTEKVHGRKTTCTKQCVRF